MLVQRLQPGFLQLGCAEVGSSDTNCYSELALQNSLCCHPCAMKAHLSHFYLWKHLGAGGINFFFAVPAVSQAAKAAGSVGQGKPWGCEQQVAQGISVWLVPLDDQQKWVLNPLWSFQKLVTATKRLVHTLISSRKGVAHSQHFAGLLFSQGIAKNYSNYHFVTRMVNSSPTNQAVWHSIPLTSLWVCGLAELCWCASNFQFTAVYCPWAEVCRTSQTPEKS